jgi:hypothetical protein
MSRKGDIVKKLLLGAIFPIWRRERTKIRGGKVEIRKEHIEIYKVIHFQNSRKTFQVKLPNDLYY